MRRALLPALLLPVLAACSAMPDYERGVGYARAGDRTAAERDLKPLAELGYASAQQELAKLYASSGDPQQLREAVQQYRAVVQERPAAAVELARLLTKLGDVDSMHQAEDLLLRADAAGDDRALPRLLELYSLRPVALPQQRMDQLMQRVQRQDATRRETDTLLLMRLGVQWNQGQGEQALVDRCKTAVARVPACLTDLARHYRLKQDKPALDELVAGAEQRSRQRPPMADALQEAALVLYDDSLPAAAQPEAAFRLLKAIDAPSLEARVEMAGLLVSAPHLDAAMNGEALLQQAAAAGSRRASMKLGRFYAVGTKLQRDPVAAERNLQEAALEFPAAHYLLGRLYLRGDLGEYAPETALRHYLMAARAGYPDADLAIAKMFSADQGVRINPVYAHAFNALALGNNVAGAAELSPLLPKLDDTQQQRAAQLALAEKQRRSSATSGAVTTASKAAMKTKPGSGL